MVTSLLLLFCAGVLAGYINAVAGAGSLLTLPALIFTGLDAAAANATNRIAVVFQNAASVWTFAQKGMKPSRGVWLLCVPTTVGSVAGAWVATLLSPRAIQISIAVAMVTFLVLSLLPMRSQEPQPAPVPALTFGTAIGFAAIGLYAGFLQAGVGILVLLYLSLFHRFGMVAGNLIKVVVVLVLTLGALLVFLLRGQNIDVLRGLTLAAATTIGAHLGVRATLRRGERFVRAAVVLTVLASVAKLLWDSLYY